MNVNLVKEILIYLKSKDNGYVRPHGQHTLVNRRLATRHLMQEQMNLVVHYRLAEKNKKGVETERITWEGKTYLSMMEDPYTWEKVKTFIKTMNRPLTMPHFLTILAVCHYAARKIPKKVGESEITYQDKIARIF